MTLEAPPFWGQYDRVHACTYTLVCEQGVKVNGQVTVGPSSLIISLSLTAGEDFLRQNLSPLSLFAHIKQTSDRRYTHSNERNASKRLYIAQHPKEGLYNSW